MPDRRYPERAQMNATAPAPSIANEMHAQWRRLRDKPIFAVLLLAWIALFQFYGISTPNSRGNYSLWIWLWDAWGNPVFDSAHGKIVPVAIAFLLWHKRDRLTASLGGARWPALAVLALSLLFHLAGFLTQQQRLSAIGLFLGFYSFVGLAWGWGAMKEAFFPLFLFAFCVPLGSFMDQLTLSLRLTASTLTRIIAGDILGVPLRQIGTTLMKPSGASFEVAAACSGLRSFTALLALTTIFAMVQLRKPWKRATIILMTVPLAVACNVLRLVVMVVADQAFGARAGHFAHDVDWIFTYGLAIACIMLMLWWLGEKKEPAAA